MHLDCNHYHCSRLYRSDLQTIGSFGGREFENETLTHNPVVFVHGVNNVAGEMMRNAAEYYKWEWRAIICLGIHFGPISFHARRELAKNGSVFAWAK